MGSMQSPLASIDNRVFRPIPNGKTIEGRIATVNGTTVILGKREALYTNRRPLNQSAHCAGRWEWSEEVTECLDLLGLLTAEEKTAHMEWLKKRKDRSEAVSALGTAMRVVEEVPEFSTAKNRAAILAMWDALDYWGQWDAKKYRYVPAGAVHKEEPKRK
jgi:hypothetical protein